MRLREDHSAKQSPYNTPMKGRRGEGEELIETCVIEDPGHRKTEHGVGRERGQRTRWASQKG